MYLSEEVCGTCKYGSPDDGTIWCMCKDSPEYFEENNWDHSCDHWEAKDD